MPSPARSLSAFFAILLLAGLASGGVAHLLAQDKPAIARPEPEVGEKPTAKEESEDSKESDDDSSSEEGSEEGEESGSDRMATLVPIGRIFEGVKIPNYSGDALSSLVKANFMRRADDEHLEMEMLEIVIYSRGEADSKILTDRAIYDMEAKTLRSTTPAKIVQKQFEMRGDRMIFDSETRIGHLSGNTKTRIFNATQMMESEEQ